MPNSILEALIERYKQEDVRKMFMEEDDGLNGPWGDDDLFVDTPHVPKYSFYPSTVIK